jgi:alpha-glucosidase
VKEDLLMLVNAWKRGACLGFLGLVGFLFLTAEFVAAGVIEVKSPDGKVVVWFDVRDVVGFERCAVYSVSCKGTTIITESRLGLNVKDSTPLGVGVEVEGVERRSGNTTWRPVYGEREEIADSYNEVKIRLQDRQGSGRRLVITFRAYNEGVAFRYEVPRQEGLGEYIISEERSEFGFGGDYECWATYSAQGEYNKVRLSEVKNGCERPLTIRIEGGPCVAVGEAALVDYARMKMGPVKNKPNTLVSSLSSEVVVKGALVTPWRVVLIGRTPGQLLENNFLFLNLNKPCAIKDTSWIKPGKVIREVTLTTAGGKACVDFAAEHGLRYVEYDAGWYGPEGSNEADARTVSVDPGRSKGPLELHEVIRYAESKGVGIILYVNRRALERQIDEILPLYRQWGIKGVKYGFVQVGSQKWTSWLHEAVRKAAENQLMVDIHDEYRPTGYSRTYPNLMTQEGIRGDETRPSNELTLTILFTRMLCGAGDNTICYYDKRVEENASHAYQLAKAVCIYSPWQFVYWYDRPTKSPRKVGGAGGGEHIIGDEPELEFFDHVSTVWDETRVIHGRIGQYAVIARRSGDEWYIGCMNANKTRTLGVLLDFLRKDIKYVAHIYTDDPNVKTRTHVRIERMTVSSETILKAAMGSKGGMAVRIVPDE